ncbi:MAG: hypothetical protein C4332_15290 [Meiothermus sp.]|mgnify:FL=1
MKKPMMAGTIAVLALGVAIAQQTGMGGAEGSGLASGSGAVAANGCASGSGAVVYKNGGKMQAKSDSSTVCGKGVAVGSGTAVSKGGAAGSGKTKGHK